jgi:hypothetical protein
MNEPRRDGPAPHAQPWPLVLCLVGVDYFSTLAYLPSIAVQAAGPLAPLAAAAVVAVTFLLALPVYWYVLGRAADGRGAAGLLEDRIPGWRGKLIVLTLLGFAAADFVITRSLSVADAAIHLLRNPHGRDLIARLHPERLAKGDYFWPLNHLLQRIAEPRVAVSLGLSILSFTAWQILKRGVRRRILLLMAAAVLSFLALNGIVIVAGALHLAEHRELIEAWRQALPATRMGGAWPWLGIVLWSFPQMALGLSGFEMIMTVAPGVRGVRHSGHQTPAERIRNTRKLMVAAAVIMATYLLGAVAVTTLMIPHSELAPGGMAEHRALSYLAHGYSAASHSTPMAASPLFGDPFGDIYDISAAVVLCLAGATVTMGLRNLLPHYLHRLGMDISWAGRVGVILHVLNVVVLLVTVVFRASPSSQQWAYATSVLVLLSGAALAALVDLSKTMSRGIKRILAIPPVGGVLAFFLAMTALTVWINQSGLAIALAFVAAILICSIISRWIRSTELRFEGFDFADDATRRRWQELCHSDRPMILAPHRPGLISLTKKRRALELDYRLAPSTPVVFVQAILGDTSNFYQKPLMSIQQEEGLELIRVSSCVSVSHVLAAICLELSRDGEPPEIIFGWSNEAPLAANLNFLLLGEGNIPWMVKALVRRALKDSPRQPRILIG